MVLSLHQRLGQRVLAAFVAANLLIASSKMPTAHAASLDIIYDQSKLVQLDEEIGSLIVGNPSIADVTSRNGTSLIITGKSFGKTNVIVLDKEGDPILEKKIIVGPDRSNTVQIYRGAQTNTYVCRFGRCKSTLNIGDGSAYFDRIQKQSVGKKAFSDASAR